VARDDQHVRLQRLDLGQRRRHVGKIAGKLVIDDDLHAELGRVIEHAGPHVLAERVVLEGQRDPHIRWRSALGLSHASGQRDRRGEILLRRRQHREQILVALVEQRA